MEYLKRHRSRIIALLISAIMITGSLAGPVFGAQTSIDYEEPTVVDAIEVPEDIEETEESEAKDEDSYQTGEIVSEEETEKSTEDVVQETGEIVEEPQRTDESEETQNQSAQEEVNNSEDGDYPGYTDNASMGDCETTIEEREEDSVGEEETLTGEDAVITAPVEQEISPTVSMNSVEDTNVVASGSCGENATWTLAGTEDILTLSIFGSGEMKNYGLNGDNRAPWFSYINNIKQIEVENGITSIGDSSFYNCTSAETISIPDSVTRFGKYAFVQCSSLSSITIPDGITVLEEAVFSSCSSLKSIKIPDSVTTIEAAAFSRCTSLTSLEIPNSVMKFVGGGQFEECTSLETLILPNTLDYIGEQFCYGCESLKRIEIPEGVKKIDARAFIECTALEEIIIPDSVELIEGRAFVYCKSLKSLSFPSSVTIEGELSFLYCESLEELTLPDGVTNIGRSAFYGCASLVSIILPDGITSIGDSAFYGCKNIKSIVIPEGVTKIEKSTFRWCSNLESVSIPDGVTEIGYEAFYGCSKLKEIDLPDSLLSIGGYSFYECESLTEILIPDGTTSIGDYAFRFCRELQKITIPGSVTSIAKTAFYSDQKLYFCYTVPGSYVSTHKPTYNGNNSVTNIIYLCDEVEPGEDNRLEFVVNPIVVSVDDVFPVMDYLVTNINISDLAISLSNNMFFYDDGTIANLESGESDLIVSFGDYSASTKVIALEKTSDEIETISFQKDNLVMEKGQITANTVTLNPQNVSVSSLNWTSSDESVVTVNHGKVTAVGAGTATVTASSLKNDSISGSFTVQVNVPLRDLIINGDSFVKIEKGKSKALKVYKYPSDTTDSITYTSSDENIVSVNEKGILSAIGFGDAVITISSGNVEKTVYVNVYRPASGIELDKTSSRLYIGESLKLNAAIKPDDATERDICWESDKESVAIVDRDGMVTAKGIGIATITATIGDYSASCKIICPEVPMTGINIEESIELKYGEEYSPSVDIIPSNTTDDKTIVWHSGDNNIFTVSESGLINAVGIGTAILTVTSGSFSDTCEISVQKAIPEITPPVDIKASCEQKLSELELPDGYSWETPTSSVGGAGEKIFVADYIPKDTEHFEIINDLSVTVIVTHYYSDEWTHNETKHWQECKCGERTSEDDHSYGEWEITKEASCVDSGNRKKACNICENIIVDTIPAIGHTWNEDYTVDKEKTCTEKGSESIHCAVCGEIDKETVRAIPKKEHAYGDWTVTKDATCTEEGSKEKVCADCGDKTTEVIPAASHTWDEDYTVDKKASCTEEGSESIHCSVCGAIDEETVRATPKKEHAYGDWTVTKDATCTEEGSKEKVCTDCGHKVAKVIPATGHVWNKNYTIDKGATCTEEGSESIHCSVCGESDKESVRAILKKEHAYGEWKTTKDATCTEEGSKEKVCADCGDKVTEEISATGHLWNEKYTVDKEATYSEEGTESIHCSVCDEIREGTSKSIAKLFKPVSMLTVSGIVDKEYTGIALTQKIVIKDGATELILGTDYIVSYSNNTNAGTAVVTISGKGSYTGSRTETFKINKAAQSIAVKASAASIAVGKTATVSITGNKGTKSYKSSNTAVATVNTAGKVTAKKVGTVTITATSAANANYNAASKAVTIKVVPAATSSITAANQATGIKLTWKKVAGATGYKVYRGATLIKTIKSGATVTCTDTKANTNGTKYIFKVIPTASTGNGLAKTLTTYRVARPAVSSAANTAAKKMTVKWKKNAKANGYQIQYSTNKKFASGNKTVNITKAATVSRVIGSLVKGKTYYVRFRTYKTVGKVKYWSAWSLAKRVKIIK